MSGQIFSKMIWGEEIWERFMTSEFKIRTLCYTNMWPATTKGTKWADCKVFVRPNWSLGTQYLATYARKWYYVRPLERGSVALLENYFPIFQCCHLSITITCILVLRNSTKRVITAVFDSSKPLLPEKWSIRLENWTKHPCTVMKYTKKLWAFLDHFYTYFGAQKSKKRGISAVFRATNPLSNPQNEVYDLKIGPGTHVWS